VAKHGQERNERQVRRVGPTVTYQDAQTGQVVYSGPVAFYSSPACEKYCARCGEWHTFTGIAGLVDRSACCPVCGVSWQDANLLALGDVAESDGVQRNKKRACRGRPTGPSWKNSERASENCPHYSMRERRMQ